MESRVLPAVGLALLLAACNGYPTAPTPLATSSGAAPAATPEATPTPTPPPAPPPAPTARYRVTFEATWSPTTHPQDPPPSPHFSGLIGGTHNDQVTFWREGAIATDGIKRMSELGSKTPLDEEVRAAIAAGNAQNLLSGGNIERAPGSAAALEFEITTAFPLVTLVSMIAPSPDWFVGVSRLSLLENGQWIDERVIQLDPWDAGTDGGVTFTSPDLPLTPRLPIARITGFPFLAAGQVPPLGTFRFVRIG